MADMNNLPKFVNSAELFLEQWTQEGMKLTDQAFAEAADLCVQMYARRADEAKKCQIKKAIIQVLESRYSTVLTAGPMLHSPNSRSWLTEERKSELLNNHFWSSYKACKEDELGRVIADKIDEETDEILGYMADPRILEPQQKKGLVIGDVQSGKTANYAGLICKAADAGYKVIVVIAGVINSLRNQTQERLERDFVGRSSRPGLAAEGGYGVSRYWLDNSRPVFSVQLLTQYTRDFNAGDAGQVRPDFEHGNIALLVIKKNVNSLKNVCEYFSNRLNERQRDGLPLLLLDDEADNASPNTREDEDPTTINLHIRKLLKLFSRHSYVGYTATPYANIFINPYVDEDAVNHGMAGQDLFPRDFIKCLSRSCKYIGATKLFDPDNDEVSDSSFVLEHNVRTIEEEKWFVQQLKKGLDPGMIPASMKEAINTFVLTKALRLIRDGCDRHCTMMIHVTQRQSGHKCVRNCVRRYWRQLQAAVRACICLPAPEHQDEMLAALKATWDEQFEYTNVTETWADVCSELGKPGFVEKFMVFEENATVRRDDAAPYSEDLRLVYRPNDPLTAIVIGGNSLARGLTLEGLCTSYFLRDSQQYDTLMQMGRWFGYRDNYADICRIFLTERMQANFAEIAQATEELKESVAAMVAECKTPMEFGLRVRNSVAGLLITARNKMRSAQRMQVWVDFSDSLRETYRIPAAPDLVEANRKTMCDFIRELDERYTRYSPEEHQDERHFGIIWENVSGTMVAEYLDRFSGMSFSQDCFVLGSLQEHLKEGKLESLDVVLIAGDDVQSKSTAVINGEEYCIPSRVPNVENGNYFFSKNHPFAKNHETGHVKETEVKRLCDLYMAEHPERDSSNPITGAELPGRYFRRAEGRRPMMMIALMAVPEPDVALKIFSEGRKEGKGRKRAMENNSHGLCTKTVAVYGFSFPKGAANLQKVKYYTVNQVALRDALRKMEDGETGDEVDEGEE